MENKTKEILIATAIGGSVTSIGLYAFKNKSLKVASVLLGALSVLVVMKVFSLNEKDESDVTSEQKENRKITFTRQE